MLRLGLSGTVYSFLEGPEARFHCALDSRGGRSDLTDTTGEY